MQNSSMPLVVVIFLQLLIGHFRLRTSPRRIWLRNLQLKLPVICVSRPKHCINRLIGCPSIRAKSTMFMPRPTDDAVGFAHSYTLNSASAVEVLFHQRW